MLDYEVLEGGAAFDDQQPVVVGCEGLVFCADPCRGNGPADSGKGPQPRYSDQPEG